MADGPANDGDAGISFPKVVALILNFNGLQDTISCVESLRRCEGGAVSILVIDNASTDGSCETLQALRPHVDLIRNPENLGYAGGMNVGLIHAAGAGFRYALLLNSDTLVEPELVREVVAYAESNPGVAVVGPRIVRHDTPSENQFRWQDAIRTPLDTIGLSGSAFLLRLSILKEVGLFDTAYFLYWEEKDFFERCVRAGLRTVYLPTRASVLHKIGASTSKVVGLQEYFMIRNGFVFIRRYKGPTWLVSHAIRSALSVLKPGNTWAVVEARLRGLCAGLVEFVGEPSIPAMAQRVKE